MGPELPRHLVSNGGRVGCRESSDLFRKGQADDCAQFGHQLEKDKGSERDEKSSRL